MLSVRGFGLSGTDRDGVEGFLQFIPALKGEAECITLLLLAWDQALLEVFPEHCTQCSRTERECCWLSNPFCVCALRLLSYYERLMRKKKKEKRKKERKAASDYELEDQAFYFWIHQDSSLLPAWLETSPLDALSLRFFIRKVPMSAFFRSGFFGGFKDLVCGNGS